LPWVFTKLNEKPLHSKEKQTNWWLCIYLGQCGWKAAINATEKLYIYAVFSLP